MPLDAGGPIPAPGSVPGCGVGYPGPVNEWLDKLADALGEPRISGRELGEVLKVARDVAHDVERRFAPVSAFMIGVAVGQRPADGASREDAFRSAVAAVRELLPQGVEPVAPEE